MSKPRIHEIDLFRGIGVLLMIAYHLAFDLNYFDLISIQLQNPPWNFLALSAQIIFIFSAGITFSLSLPQSISFTKAISAKYKYLLKLTVLALIISLFTWILFQDDFVKFGILHFYVLATILTIPFHQLKFWNGLLGTLIILATFFLPTFATPWWLYPIGLSNQIIPSFDYFPLFPWYGVFLLGTTLGNLLTDSQYTKNPRPSLRNNLLEQAGRHSLLIYLLNQPLIILLLFLFIQIKNSSL